MPLRRRGFYGPVPPHLGLWALGSWPGRSGARSSTELTRSPGSGRYRHYLARATAEPAPADPARLAVFQWRKRTLLLRQPAHVAPFPYKRESYTETTGGG
jgi:hypothetical protein